MSGEVSNRLGLGVLGGYARKYGDTDSEINFRKGLEVADGFSGLNTNDIVLLGSRHLIADFTCLEKIEPIINFTSFQECCYWWLC